MTSQNVKGLTTAREELFPLFSFTPLNTSCTSLRAYFESGKDLNRRLKNNSLNCNAACHFSKMKYFASDDFFLMMIDRFSSTHVPLSFSSFIMQVNLQNGNKYFGLRSQSAFHFGFTPNSIYMAL